MSVRPITQNGKVVSFEATAGQINGRKLRKRFRVSVYGGEDKAFKAAQTWANNKAKQIRATRGYGALMSERLLVQVSEAIELLSPHNTSLIDCVREWVRDREHPKVEEPVVAAAADPDSWTFRQACLALLKEREDRGAAPQYLHDLKRQLNAFGDDFSDRELNSISTNEIEAWLDGRISHIKGPEKDYPHSEKPLNGKETALVVKKLSPTTRRNWRRDLSMVWHFALLRGHASRNPAAILARSKRPETDITFLPVEDAERLFSVLRKMEDFELQQVRLFASLACFCGLRTSEISRLNWEQVNLSEWLIEVRAKGRTRRRRLVPIPENLRDYLTKISVAKGVVIGISTKTIRARLKLLRVCPLPANVMRHSWFTYHMALYQNQHLTQLEGGHVSPDVLYRHYRALVPREQATRWFAISP